MKRLVAFLLVFTLWLPVIAQTAADSLLFERFLQFAALEKLERKTAGERVSAIGKFFLETPYTPNTLEAPGPERLQVNLRELDCTTLVENALALSRLLVSPKKDFETYRQLLIRIRYRNGNLDGYPSRLHYASDWITDNVQKGFVAFVNMGSETERLSPKVNYMSTHPTAYSALVADSLLIPFIVAQEVGVNQLSFSYLPKSKVTPQAPCIQHGDIIAITTSLSGLDFSHLGIAVRQKGKLHLLHASSTGKKVLLSEKPLSDYLAGIKKHTGIVVVRPL